MIVTGFVVMMGHGLYVQHRRLADSSTISKLSCER
jgi:hypothetical protein